VRVARGRNTCERQVMATERTGQPQEQRIDQPQTVKHGLWRRPISKPSLSNLAAF